MNTLAIAAVRQSPINVNCEIVTGFNSANKGAPIENIRANTLHIPKLVAFILAGNKVLLPIQDKFKAEATPNMEKSISIEKTKLLCPFS